MIPASVRIFVCTEPLDMRRSFDGLARAAREVLGQDPQGGALFGPVATGLSTFSVRSPGRTPACHRSLHEHATANEIEIVPPQRHQLAKSQTRAQRDDDHRLPLGLELGRCDQSVRLVEVEEAEARRRSGEPLDPGNLLEQGIWSRWTAS